MRLDHNESFSYLQVVNGLRRDDLEFQCLAERSECRAEVPFSIGRVGLVPAHVNPSEAELQSAVVFVAELEGASDGALGIVVQTEVVLQVRWWFLNTFFLAEG